MAAMVESTTCSKGASETSHTAFQSSLLPPLSSPSSSAVRPSWYLAVRARLPGEAFQRPEITPSPPVQSCRCPWTSLRAPLLASHSSHLTHGSCPMLWATWPSTPDNVNHSVTKVKAVIVFHTPKDHIWSIGSERE